MFTKEEFGEDTLGCMQSCAYRKLTINDMCLQLYGIRYMGETAAQTAAHRHDYCEFYYVARGFFMAVANGRRYVYRQGQYGLLTAGLQHLHPTNTINGFAIRFQIKPSDARGEYAGDAPQIMRMLKKITPAPMTDADDELWDMLGRIVERGEAECMQTEMMLMLARFLLVVIQRYASSANDAPADDAGAKETDIVNEAMNYLQAHCTERITPSDVAGHVHISYSHLARLFARHGYPGLHSQIQKARIDRAQNLLLTTDMSIAEIAETTGYKYVSHFSAMFQKLAGVTATEYRLSSAKIKGGVPTVL